MAVTLNGFSAYVKANPNILIDAVIKSSSVFDSVLGFSVFDDVKSKAERPLNIGATVKYNSGDPARQFADAIAGTGTAVKSDLTMNSISVEDEQLSAIFDFTTYEFDAALTQEAKKQGSASDDLVYIAAFTALVTSKMREVNDEMVWQGDTASSDINLKKFDGFVKQIKSATGADKAIVTGTAAAPLTAANAISKINELITTYNANFPKLIKVKKGIYLSNADFQVARKAFTGLTTVIDKNTIISDSMVTMYQVPGTNVYLYAMDGLDGTNEQIMCRPAVLSPVTDSASEDAAVTLTQDPTTEIWYFKSKFKLGAKVAITSEVVYAAAAA